MAASVVLVLILTQAPAPPVAGPRNMPSGGLRLIGSEGAAVPVRARAAATHEMIQPVSAPDGAVGVVIYEDLLCPACRVFEEVNLPYLQRLVADGEAELEIHPIAILDRMSAGSRYSTRAASALACVADRQPDAFLPANVALFARQPSEGSRGLSNRQIADVLSEAGADDPTTASCVRSGAFTDWVGAVTTIRTNTPAPGTGGERITGTPTVLVDGERFDGSISDSAAFQRFVESARDRRGSR
ncbi:DsbA family protein [Curtobacterium ammoniigenes]|uniref:DsbA family protein n=1 Tax=Curtobacterium ammoniigenes TaxID=395387 RepID=UPI00147017AF|nr:thioredoxin domain-containing protein [Curtobacterium ammoniigenes]